MDCSRCNHRRWHRKWQEGDPSELSPGHGVYYCDLTTFGTLSEEIGNGKQRPTDCPLTPDLLPGNVWSHRNGHDYVVLHLANAKIDPNRFVEYPMTVVYRRVDEPEGEVYAKKPHEFILNRMHKHGPT